jgi:hypothetical protein
VLELTKQQPERPTINVEHRRMICELQGRYG